MRCLVTGGAGFIGSHLCDALLGQGHSVICVDNLLTGKKDNITHLLNNPRFEFLEKDCRWEFTFDQVETIFHFASPASPPKYQTYPVETLQVNTQGTYLLLEKARVWKARFIFASTSEVYGDPRQHPQKETYWGHVNPIGRRACYDEAKRAGEAYVKTYQYKYGLENTIIRIFNTYGPRMDINDGRVVTNFIRQIINKTSLTIYGDGKQTRSFCYISDLIAGIMLIFENKKTNGEVYNLGNPDEMTVLDLAQEIQKIASYKGNIVYEDLPADDPERRKPNITKITRLGWSPKVSLTEGLQKTLASFA